MGDKHFIRFDLYDKRGCSDEELAEGEREEQHVNKIIKQLKTEAKEKHTFFKL